MKFKLIQLIQQESNSESLKLFLYALLAGVANVLILILIQHGTALYAKKSLSFQNLFLFVVCVLLYVATKKYTFERIIGSVQSAIMKFRVRIFEKIGKSSLTSFDDIESSRITVTLSEKAEVLTQAARSFSESATSCFMALFSFLYIAWLSMEAFCLFSISMVIVTVVYAQKHGKIRKMIHQSMKKDEEFFQSLFHLLNGFKELKMNRLKHEDLRENYLKRISVENRFLRTQIEESIEQLNLLVKVFLYAILGTNLFILPQIANVEASLVVNLTTVILFLWGPLGSAILMVPNLTKADLAIENLMELEALLDKGREETEHGAHQQKESAPQQKFQEIKLEKVFFQYPKKEDSESFSIGPINMTIASGDLTFIVGGNGSGKSTFMKILTGLYPPHKGTIYLDGKRVRSKSRIEYRENFSVLFTDFHLFDRLYGLGDDDIDEKEMGQWLKKMQLEEKTHFLDGRFSNLDLSTGQRKRLALIVCMFDDKPIYVFDEVAADQDPSFRRYFYEQFLVELREEGKTVIAVTHDDKYFKHADHLYKLDYGVLTKLDKQSKD